MSDPTTLRLTLEQQQNLFDQSRIGLPLFDSLILCGFREQQIEGQLLNDPDVRDTYLRGRAHGYQPLRQVMNQAALSGNVSAMKAMRLLEPEPEPQEEPSKRHEKAVNVDVMKSVDAAFRRMRELMEEADASEEE
jgi:hypothetical protein